MKAIILNLFIIVGLFLGGCSNDSSLVGPAGTDITNQSVQSQGHSFIGLPFTSLAKDKKAEKEIDGKKGGKIEIEGKLENGIKFEAKLVIPKGAFDGKKVIKIKFDKQQAAFDFSPYNTEFDKPLLFSAKIKGINLDGIDPNDIQFVYLLPNGTLAPVVYDKMKVDVKEGKLEVKNAQLHHFSRYGWAK